MRANAFTRMNRHGAFSAPAQTRDAFFNTCAVDSSTVRPFGNSQRFTEGGEMPNDTRIIGLFSNCCPSAILRLIVAIIVDTVNLMLRGRTFAHIVEEVRKRIFPPIADFYTSTTVIFKTFFFLVVAPAFHAFPNTIFSRVRHAVSSKAFDVGLHLEASTAFRNVHFSAWYADDITAGALAEPTVNFSGVHAPRITNHVKSEKDTTLKIYKSRVCRFTFKNQLTNIVESLHALIIPYQGVKIWQ